MNKAHLALAALAAASLLSSCASPVIFAGATTGGVMATDNRTPGSFIEDQG
ncbi:MAG: transporter, partial [Betaproteobacteria bacterium AqS2]|nr:transporter [Betaproteobacteria bacterium AqS2]